MNEILYDLHPGLYDVDVRVSEGCTEVDTFIKRFRVQAKDEKVRTISLFNSYSSRNKIGRFFCSILI